MATKAIVGSKVGMTQIWDADNNVVPATALHVDDCRVVMVKTVESDGYSAIQIASGIIDAAKLNKPEAGHFGKAGVTAGTRLLELRLDDVSGFKIGQGICVDILSSGEKVDVTAVSKGSGFTGVMKRHGFSGQPAAHGAHKVHRKPGAIGQCATPSRVFKGKKMPGRSGAKRVTTLNLEVLKVDPEAKMLLIKGSIPGPKGGTVLVRNAVKGK